MANSSGWGDGAANNTVGWGQGANNNIGWGKSHSTSWAGATDIVGTLAPSFDPNAQAFITAAAITDATQQTAIDNLVIGLKADGLWTKMRCIYPFVGGTATAHKWNLKDPRDLDAAYRLAFSGGLTHSSTGCLPNGVNGFANSFFIPTTLGNDNIHFSAYYRNNGLNDVRMIGCLRIEGDINEGTTVANHSFFVGSNNTRINYTNGGTTIGNGIITNSIGNFISTRTDLINSKVYKNNSLLSSSSIGFGNSVSKFYLMACNYNTTETGDLALEFSNHAISFSTIGEGLDNTQSVNLYNRIQAFQTALSRNV